MNAIGMPNAEQTERIALLSEEMAEVQQALNKTIRHGFNNYNPLVALKVSNKQDIETEVGHVLFALMLMHVNKDIDLAKSLESIMPKAYAAHRWLHRQGPELSTHCERIMTIAKYWNNVIELRPL